MGSLNDYKWYESKRRPGAKRWRGWWLQAGLSLALLLAVASSIGVEGLPGRAARYVAGPALLRESSWFSFGRAEPVVAASATLPAADQSLAVSAPKFLAPASGVVVKDLALDLSGLTCEQGIVIQGLAGQSVKAAAAGEVIYLGESASGFIVELKHQGGFSSVYQGLSELAVGAGQEVAAGESLGVTATGELLFALFAAGQELDPLVYLFQQQV